MDDPQVAVGSMELLRRHGLGIIGAALVAAIVVYLICMIPAIQVYEGQATILFPLRKSAVGLRRALGSVDLPVGGVSSAIGQMQQAYPAPTILESRRILDLVLQKHPELKKGLDKKNKGDLESMRKKVIKKYLKLDDTDQGALKISFLWKDPQVAADIANEYVDQLQFIFTDLNAQSAQQMADFIGARIDNEKPGTPGIAQRIAKIETEIAEYKKTTGILAIDPQAEQLIKSLAVLQEELTGAEVDLAGARTERDLIAHQGEKLTKVRDDFDQYDDVFDLDSLKDQKLVTLAADEKEWREAPIADALADPAVATLRRTLALQEA
ncbi:MAG: hypothetical protein ABI743_12925, partial [bacterium]